MAIYRSRAVSMGAIAELFQHMTRPGEIPRPSPGWRPKNTGFTGAQLREMRSRNGVGRPPKNKPAPYNAS